MGSLYIEKDGQRISLIDESTELLRYRPVVVPDPEPQYRMVASAPVVTRWWRCEKCGGNIAGTPTGMHICVPSGSLEGGRR